MKTKINFKITKIDGVRRYSKHVAEQVFCHVLSAARQGVYFGPLNGFGGYGSDKVMENLPKWMVSFYESVKIPTAILVSYPHSVINYIEACGIDFGKLFGHFLVAAEEYHKIKIVEPLRKEIESHEFDMYN